MSKRSIGDSEPEERPVGVVVARGAGQVVLITCGQSFSNSDYGYRYAMIPDQSLRRLYETEYAIMAAAIGVGPDPEGAR